MTLQNVPINTESAIISLISNAFQFKQHKGYYEELINDQIECGCRKNEEYLSTVQNESEFPTARCIVFSSAIDLGNNKFIQPKYEEFFQSYINIALMEFEYVGFYYNLRFKVTCDFNQNTQQKDYGVLTMNMTEFGKITSASISQKQLKAFDDNPTLLFYLTKYA